MPMVRRGFDKIEEQAGLDWLQRHLDYTTRPLLSEPWILDIDTTVKPLYGHQEGAVVSYNPNKRGRPSHSYHDGPLAGTGAAGPKTALLSQQVDIKRQIRFHRFARSLFAPSGSQ